MKQTMDKKEKQERWREHMRNDLERETERERALFYVLYVNTEHCV